LSVTPGTAALGAIFDMDGVLVDSAELHYRAWSRLGEELGAPHPREVFERTFGMHNRQIIPIWLGRELPPDELEALSVRKEALYREAAAAGIAPLEGVIDLIGSLWRSGFALAVGSSGPLANVELILDALGVRDRFTALSTGDDVTHGKPDPEVFIKAARKLGLPPERCAVIEDAPQGVEAGLRAGARVVAVASTRPARELRAAHLVVSSLAELDAPRLRRVIELGGLA
jgi:HAD superfamily hydrolase (TIGR01509 family)